MPISFQCLQNKRIGEFYNETHKGYNHLLMRCNSNHNNRVDNCNANLSNFKESGVAMDFISATNNNCPDFRKKTSVDTTKKTLVTLAIFLLSIQQADSLNLNTSTEVSTPIFPSSNQTGLNGFGVIDSRYEVTDDYQKKQTYIRSDSEIKAIRSDEKSKIHRVKRGCDKDKLCGALDDIVARIEEVAFASDRDSVIGRIVREIDQSRNQFDLLGIGHLRNLPRPIILDDLPRDLVDNIERVADIEIDNILFQQNARRREMDQPEPPPEDQQPGPSVQEEQMFGDDEEEGDDP